MTTPIRKNELICRCVIKSQFQFIALLIRNNNKALKGRYFLTMGKARRKKMNTLIPLTGLVKI